MENYEEGRVPPQAVEVEESILGSMLLEKEAAEIVSERLTPGDFYKPGNRSIFEAIILLKKENKPIDLLSVENKLRDQELLDRVGGSIYLSDLTRSVSSAANVEYHAQIVKEKALLRSQIETASDVIKKAYDPGADPYDIQDLRNTHIIDFEKGSHFSVPESATKSAGVVLLETIMETNVKDGMVGIPAYLPIDRLTAGFPNKELIYIAARPSMGKTAYMLTIIKNLIENDFSEPIVIFSYEMDTDILILRLLCMMARVNMQFARRGKLEPSEKGKLVKAAKYLGIDASFDEKTNKLDIHSYEQSMLFIEDDNNIDPDQMKAKLRRIKKDHGLGIVFIDYLQLVPVNNSKQKNIGTREQEVAHISRSMKAQAKEFDVPYIVLSQLSRAVENRKGDPRPQLSDLRESGSIEQDATMVMFLYRPEYYDKKRTDEGLSTLGLAEIILKKNRNGPLGTEKHTFIKEYALFEEWDEENAQMRSGSQAPQQAWMLGRDDPGATNENLTDGLSQVPEDLDDDMPF